MKSVMKYGAFLFVLIVLAGCVSQPDEDPSTAWRLEMEEGETVEVNTNFDVFVSAISDSRCPRGETCASAGVAAATVVIQATDANYQYQINNTDDIEVTNEPYKVTFLLMRPYPDPSVPSQGVKLVRFQIDKL